MERRDGGAGDDDDVAVSGRFVVVRVARRPRMRHIISARDAGAPLLRTRARFAALALKHRPTLAMID